MTPATVDNALYDAFGQRIASTIFTQSNQYRVILEAAPSLQRSLDSIGSIYVPSSAGSTSSDVRGGPSTAVGDYDCLDQGDTVADRASWPVSGGDDFVQFGARRVAGRGGPGNSGSAAGDETSSQFYRQFSRRSSAFESSLTNEVLLLVAAIVTMYIILGVLYESFIHPITILSTLAFSGGRSVAGADADRVRAGCHGYYRHPPADRDR